MLCLPWTISGGFSSSTLVCQHTAIFTSTRNETHFWSGQVCKWQSRNLLRRLMRKAWWRHQMEAFAALLAFCKVTGEFPSGQLHGTLMLSLICVGANSWTNNRDAGDLRSHGSYYDVALLEWKTVNSHNKDKTRDILIAEIYSNSNLNKRKLLSQYDFGLVQWFWYSLYYFQISLLIFNLSSTKALYMFSSFGVVI